MASRPSSRPASASSPTTSRSASGASSERGSPRASRPPRSTSSPPPWRRGTRRSGTEERPMPKTTLTFALMDPPYESENLTTAFRLLDVAARRGYDLKVFTYEGAVSLAFERQAPHPNPVHGKDLAEENHPTTKDQIAALLAEAEKNGGKVDWVNCGLCADERGVNEFVAGTRRGSPADFHAFVEASDNVLVIPTK